jgi:ABC-2 type transport system permease protein
VRSLRGREAVALVARREFTQKLREKSFLVSMGVTVAIIVLVAVIPPLLGAGGPSTFTVATVDASSAQIAAAARARRRPASTPA